MDSSNTLSSWDRAQQFLQKNIELENSARKSVQAKVPSDPNIWHQIRENYEAIILTDQEITEKHDIEYLLWQLHHRRIDEFRSHLNTAASNGLSAPQVGKDIARADRIKRIRSTFKSFLTEATGFYHDLMMKIRSKYGLPLGYFNEALENPLAPAKDEKRTVEMKKGLMSCHRCLIYLGDLARYKGLYGESDSINREYAAAASYYKQAASLCPSSGNPHHQLAILAAYSSDDLLALYQYFRSLAVDSPFTTARENLIIAFEKNRQNYCKLPSNNKVSSVKPLPSRPAGRNRGRGDKKLLAKDSNADTATGEEKVKDMHETFKTFCIRFVRLNGILFAKTSLETFGEILTSVIGDLVLLLSSGSDEVLNFGNNASENALTILKLISILIFTIHNVKRESGSQSYAEIVQRTVLCENAFSAAYLFVGHILKRCVELRDASTSFCLPGILVFIEWLACHLDIAAGSCLEERQVEERSFFWNQCVLFMNNLIITGLASVDSSDITFCDMSSYDEGETGNRLALWEDFELRGFLPLAPAHAILDFSNKHNVIGEASMKEKKARVQRILAAGMVLANVVEVDQLKLYFEPSSKRFMIGEESQTFDSLLPLLESSSDTLAQVQVECNIASEMRHPHANFAHQMHSKVEFYGEADEDEVIVFKPAISDKISDVATLPSSIEYMQSVKMPDVGIMVNEEPPSLVSSSGWSAALPAHGLPSVPNNTRFLEHFQMVGSGWGTNSMPVSVPQVRETCVPPSPQVPRNTSPGTSTWLPTEEACLLGLLKNTNIGENGFFDQKLQCRLNGLQDLPLLDPIQDAAAHHPGFNQISSIGPPELAIPSLHDTVFPLGAHPNSGSTISGKPLPAVSRKNPVSRPGRHAGPPPGFGQIPAKRQDERNQEPQIDDYRWLDGYQPQPSKVGDLGNHLNHKGPNPYATAFGSPAFNNSPNLPTPGKNGIIGAQAQASEKGGYMWQDFQLFDAKPVNGAHQANQPDGFQREEQIAQSLWSGGYFV